MSVKIKTQSDLDNKFFNCLQHMNTTGVLALLSNRRDKSHPYNYFNKDISEILEHAHSSRYNAANRNQFMSINSFRVHRRKSKFTVGLNGLFIDADLKENGIDLGRFFYPPNFDKLLRIAGLPEPTALEDSAHGAYLIYLFNQQVQVNNPVINYLWEKLERTIVKKFNRGCRQMYGAAPGDPKSTDSSRVLRIPNTNNIKKRLKDYGKPGVSKYPKARLLWFDPANRHPMFTYWINSYIPRSIYDKKKRATQHKFRRNTKARRHPGKAKRVRSVFYKFKIPKGIKWQRTRDLLKLLPLRHYQMSGYRDIFLFIYACLTVGINGTAGTIEDIKRLNQQFTEPLESAGITNLIIEIEHSYLEKYRFKSCTIIEWLDITPKEQHRMLNIMGHKEANRRKYRRKHTTRNKRRERDNKVIRMYQDGFAQREMVNQCNVSRSTIKRIITKFKRDLPTKKASRIDQLIMRLHQVHMKPALIAIRLKVSMAYIRKVIRSPSSQ